MLLVGLSQRQDKLGRVGQGPGDEGQPEERSDCVEEGHTGEGGVEVASLAQLHLRLLAEAAGDVLVKVEEHHHWEGGQGSKQHTSPRDGREVRIPDSVAGGVEAARLRVDERHREKALVEIPGREDRNEEADRQGIILEEHPSLESQEFGRLERAEPPATRIPPAQLLSLSFVCYESAFEGPKTIEQSVKVREFSAQLRILGFQFPGSGSAITRQLSASHAQIVTVYIRPGTR